MEKSLKNSLTAQEKWLRFLFMIFFFVINYFIQMLIGIIALFQFIFTLFKDEPNDRVVEFGDSLSQFIYQIMHYLTYTSNEKPFPFSEWPTPSHPAGHSDVKSPKTVTPPKAAREKEGKEEKEKKSSDE